MLLDSFGSGILIVLRFFFEMQLLNTCVLYFASCVLNQVGLGAGRVGLQPRFPLGLLHQPFDPLPDAREEADYVASCACLTRATAASTTTSVEGEGRWRPT